MMLFAILAATLLNFSSDGVVFAAEAESAKIDPALSVFLDTELVAGADVAYPDLRDRVRGFSLAEDDREEPVKEKDGRVRQRVHWRLVPEPSAKVYKIAPFALGDKVAGPIYFEPPEKAIAEKGPMVIDPKKDMPPLSWRLAGKIALYLTIALATAAAVFFSLRYVTRRVKEHRMSPIERARVELERLLKKGLPGRGRYKDFYVELTQLVRRYVQRKYGIKAPHMTTEEFLAGFREGEAESREALGEFMRSSDMVKFAGVEATPDMADDATASARAYLEGDNKPRDEVNGRASGDKDGSAK